MRPVVRSFLQAFRYFISSRVSFARVALLLVLIPGIPYLIAYLHMRGSHDFVNSKRENVRLFIRATMKVPLSTYKIDTGDFPSTTEGLQALFKAPRGKERLWRGPYLEIMPPDRMPRDLWGNDYIYLYPGTHNPGSYDLLSAGPDGQPGTVDDIGNW